MPLHSNLAILFLLFSINFRHSLVEAVYGYGDSGGYSDESEESGEYGGGYFQGGYGREYGGHRPTPYYGQMPGWQYGYATGPFSAGGFDGPAGWPPTAGGWEMGKFWVPKVSQKLNIFFLLYLYIFKILQKVNFYSV
jgi:hypothetical protein